MQEVPPIWLMRQAGRYLPEYRALRAKAGSFLDLCYSPARAAEVTMQPIRRFGFDAAIIFADILLIPQALGQDLRFAEGEGPILAPIRDAKALSALTMEGLHKRLEPIYETVSRVHGSLDDQTALIGFAGAPWTVATYMVEGGGSRNFENIKVWAYRDPAGFGALIDLIVEATIAYLSRQIDAGAEAVQLFDTWAGVLPETAFARWCIEPTQRIVAALRAAYPTIPVIGFPRGAGVSLQDYAARTGVQGVGLDSAVPLSWARQAVQSQCTVQGNLDPLMVVAGGTAMTNEARRIVSAFKDGPFVFNLGHGILPQTPPEHVAALVAAVRATA
ncbi:MAG: uroporphyrinogen decarboxylase [Alphaproteobacteria bacterium]|nr:uroporphyrinogen decarboxylase [Alphaproteobacteria bacterium]